MRTPPSTERVRIALDSTSGTDFENFILMFLAAVLGANFRPLGGMHDGGADGVVDAGLFVHEKRSTSFMQASTEKDTPSKVRATVRRLREVGREPKQLLYVTNQTISKLDQLEEILADQSDMVVRIYDRNYIVNHLPNSAGAIAAYFEYLHHRTLHLDGIGRGTILSNSAHIDDPYVYTYLAGHVNPHESDGTFADGVLDALIVFALEGTDPNAGIMRSEEEIRSKIVETLPNARQLLDYRLRTRLEAISKKGNRRIRWHRKEDRWALPYEERIILEQSSLEAANLRLTVHDELKRDFEEAILSDVPDSSTLSEIALATAQRSIEKDGLSFAKFLSDRTSDDASPFVSDALREILDEYNLVGDSRHRTAEAIGTALRTLFYSSSASQRTLLQRMSKAYVIAFALKLEPRVLRYFDDILQDTWLYVGTDVLVSALSERFVPQADQHTRNLLKAAHISGARLILTAPVLDELVAHLRGTDREYQHYVEPLGDIDSFDIARQQPKILLRAFLYTQVSKNTNRPRSWMQFVNQFCNHNDLHKPTATRQIQHYLMSEFNLEVEAWHEVQALSDPNRHIRLVDSLSRIKATQLQANNDAYVYELVTSRRLMRSEETRSPEFGFQTWWLSAGERLAVTAMSGIDNSSDPILMQPAFLIKYIQFAPSAKTARDELGEFLPSLLGIRLARRVAENDFHNLVQTVVEAESLESGGRLSRMSHMVDRLKSASQDEYGVGFDVSHESLSIDTYYDAL